MLPRLSFLKRTFRLGISDGYSVVGWFAVWHGPVVSGIRVVGREPLLRGNCVFDGGYRDMCRALWWARKPQPNEMLPHRWGNTFPRRVDKQHQRPSVAIEESRRMGFPSVEDHSVVTNMQRLLCTVNTKASAIVFSQHDRNGRVPARLVST